MTSKNVFQKDFDRPQTFPLRLLTEDRLFENEIAAAVRQGRHEGDHGRDVQIQRSDCRLQAWKRHRDVRVNRFDVWIELCDVFVDWSVTRKAVVIAVTVFVAFEVVTVDFFDLANDLKWK